MTKETKETKESNLDERLVVGLYEDQYTRLSKERPDNATFIAFVSDYCKFMTMVYNARLDILNDVSLSDYVDKLDLNDTLNIFKMLNIMKKEIYRIDNVINNAIYTFRKIADFTDDGVIIKIKDFQGIGSTLPYGAEIHQIYKDMGLKGIVEVTKLCEAINNKEKLVNNKLFVLNKEKATIKRQFEVLDEQKKQLRELIKEFNRNSSDYEVLINSETGKVECGKKEPVTNDEYHLFS